MPGVMNMSAFKSWWCGAICLALIALHGAVLQGTRYAWPQTADQSMTFLDGIVARSIGDWLRPTRELESNSGIGTEERFSEYVYLHHTRDKSVPPTQLCR